MVGWGVRVLVLASVVVMVRGQNATNATTTTQRPAAASNTGSFGIHMANVFNAVPYGLTKACQNAALAAQDVVRAIFGR